MDNELDLDDAIASILGDSDDEKKKKTQKKKLGTQKSARVSSKALTSSVSDEDFYKNLSQITEEPSKEDVDNIVVTEEDAKKMASDLAGLDDLDSDLLGTIGKKTPKSKSPNTELPEKHIKNLKQKSSTGSIHRKGSVTPAKGQRDLQPEPVEGHLFSDSEDDLNSSMNSTTKSRHRKSGGSKKSPNKISPRVSFDDAEKDAKGRTTEQSKSTKSKDISFDSDSDLPGLENKSSEKKSEKKTGKKEVKRQDDLFGDDDDLPDLDNQPKKPASSALDNLMGTKTKSEPKVKTKPASLDEFMAKVSTKPAAKTEARSPSLRSPSLVEDQFQFGGYMPSSASTGRRTRRGDTTNDSGRRSVTFSNELGVHDDDDIFGMKKRPSTAPTTRKKRDEQSENVDPLSSTFTAPSSTRRGTIDNSNWLGLDDKDQKGDILSPQLSLEGSKSSASGDWLGLGDDVTEDQLNASMASTIQSDKSPEQSSTPVQQPQTSAPDNKNNTFPLAKSDIASEDKTATSNQEKFPWEGGRRRRNHFENDSTNSPIQTSETIGRETSAITSEIANNSNQNQVTTNQRTRNIPRDQRVVSNHVPTTEQFTIPQQPRVVDRSAHDSPLPQTRDSQSIIFSPSEKLQIEDELKRMRDKTHEMETVTYKKDLDFTNKIAELETKVRRLEVENEGLVHTLELTKQRHKDELSSLENAHKTRTDAIEESYRRREARQKDETDEFLAKHKETLCVLEQEKTDLQTTHTRKLTMLENNKVKEIERLNEVHRRVLEDLRNEHAAEMNHVKQMKEQEISATMTAFAHTKSLQTLMDQVLNSTKQVENLHHLVELSHKNNQDERGITAKVKDDYLNQLQERLLKQQSENDEERTRLQNLVAKMEVHVREQDRRLEEDRWKLTQEESRLNSLRVSLEEERRITREQLETERSLVQKTKEEFMIQQRRMLTEVNEERRTLSLERSELTAAQRGMLNTEKHKQTTFIKMDAEQESSRKRLEDDIASLRMKEDQLKRERGQLRRETEEFEARKEKWRKEKDLVTKRELELERKSKEMEDINSEAKRVHEEGTKAIEQAKEMQHNITKQSNEIQTKMLQVQEKEREIAEQRLEILKEKRESEMNRRHGLCGKCSQPLTTKIHIADTNEKRETLSPGQLFSPQSSFVQSFKTPGADARSTPLPTQPTMLTPDLLLNTLDLKRTLRRWSQDKEEDEEFLENETEFLNSLGSTRIQNTFLRS